MPAAIVDLAFFLGISEYASRYLPPAVLPVPAEDGTDEETLPRLKPDGLALGRPLALRMVQQFNKLAGALSGLNIEPQVFPLKVGKVPIAGQPHPLTCRNVATLYRTRVIRSV
jgi:hypothetical protein